MKDDLCTTPTLCPSAMDKSGTRCGHEVLYGVGACWRRDGPERKAGLQGSESPFQWEEGEVRE